MDGKILIPEGMLKAATAHVDMKTQTGDAVFHNIKTGLEAALLWLSKNPIVPTYEQIESLLKICVQNVPGKNGMTLYQKEFCKEWQRIMFLSPDPEVPEEIKDLLYCEQDRIGIHGDPVHASKLIWESDRRAIEAYHRGQRSK